MHVGCLSVRGISWAVMLGGYRAMLFSTHTGLQSFCGISVLLLMRSEVAVAPAGAMKTVQVLVQ